MNELFDELILRVIFASLLFLALFAYKCIHVVLYPHSLNKLRTKFNPSENPAETLHLFSRLLGLGIIFSGFHLYVQDGIVIVLIDFVVKSTFTFLFFLSSIYVIESIILYDVEYKNEILDKKNLTVSIISSTHALGMAFVIKSISGVSNDSMVVFVVLWLLSLVLMGLAVKIFILFFRSDANRIRGSQNFSSTASYIGFFGGCSALVYAILHQPMNDLRWYSIDVILKTLLCLIVFPVFIKGLDWIYKFHRKSYLKKSINPNGPSASIPEEDDLGRGIFQGVSFFTSSLFTIIVTENIFLGKPYFLG